MNPWNSQKSYEYFSFSEQLFLPSKVSHCFCLLFFLEIYHYFNPKPSARCPNCFSVFSVASGNLILSSYGRIFPEQNIPFCSSLGWPLSQSHPSVSPLGWVPGARSPFLNFHPHFGRIYPLVTSWEGGHGLYFQNLYILNSWFQFMLNW